MVPPAVVVAVVTDIEGTLDPDRQLLAQVAAGDEAAFAELVERHQARLLRLCERLLHSSEEARDAVQEVFLKAYRKAGSFQPRGQVFTWLYRIATNHCLNQLRRRRLVRFIGLGQPPEGDEAAPPEPVDEAPDAATALAARRRWQATRRAITELPANQRAVLVLARFEGLPYRQIAQVLGITEGAVESRLFRALRRLEQTREQETAS